MMQGRRGSGLTKELRGLGPMLAFGAAVNLLALASPLFLLLLYDLVLPAADTAGLVALLVMALGIHAVMGGLDAARLRLSARTGALLAAALSRRIAAAARDRDSLPEPARLEGAVGQLVRPLSGPLATAVSDLGWTPILLLAVFFVHPALGWLALAGGGLLLAVTLAMQRSGQGAAATAAAATADAAQVQARMRLSPPGAPAAADAAVLAAARARLGDSARIAAEATGHALAFGRSARLMLHAALLATGAWLVMAGTIGTGAMLAVVVLTMRALAPIDIVAMQLDQLAAARAAWHLLRAAPGITAPSRATAAGQALPWLEPDPAEGLEVVDAAVLPHGASGPVLQRISLRLRPGEVLGVTGPPGSGKSLLGALLAGLVAPAAGCVVLGGVPLSRIAPGQRAALIGHLPQRVAVAPGSVVQNVALAAPRTDRAGIGRALRRADLAAALARLPAGAATRLDADGAPLSASAVERLGLARALVGPRALVILDTPLPSGGAAGRAEIARLARNLAAEGAMVVLIAPDLAALGDCDGVLVLERGLPALAGPPAAVCAAQRRPPGHAAPLAPISPAGAA